MKKLVAGALALALGFSAFAQEAHELVGSAGKISFGAWGRSTFNIGADNTSTKIDVNAKLSDNAHYNAVYNQTLLAIQNGDPTATAAVAKAMGIGLDTNAAAKYVADANASDTANYAAVDSKVVSMSPIQSSDTSDVEWYASVAPDWSYGCRVGFWIIGRTNDERWGFDFNLDSDAAALFVGAQNYDSDSVVGNLKQKNNGLSYAESGKYAVAIGKARSQSEYQAQSVQRKETDANISRLVPL